MYNPAPALPPPTSMVELKVRCKNLVDLDAFSLSDPQCFLFLEDRVTGRWSDKPHAITERVKDSLNPAFVKGLQVEYRFESIQRLKFVIYDIDVENSGRFSDHDFVGEAITDMGSIIGARGRQIALKLIGPKTLVGGGNRGQIIIQAEEMSSSKRVLNFAIRANDLTKKGMFKTAPSSFFIIHRANESGAFVPVYQSDVIRNHDDPAWLPFTIKESILCNGDQKRQLKIEVKSHKANGSHTCQGTTLPFTVEDLTRQKFPYTMPIPPLKGSSVLTIQSFHVTEPPSFLDFLAGGGTLGLAVAIDFTQSNGDPRSPQSLHYRSPNGENEYTKAIRSVGSILQCYDTDKMFPVYGFGGRVAGQVSHCFPLNGNPSNPEVHGVEGILASYWHALTFAELYGPTNFAPVIQQTAELARLSKDHVGGYTVLLILTDGAITDMNNTIEAIRAAAKQPLSIIIVGVGNANFKSMNTLDGDDPESAALFKNSRDITQFVPARDFPAHHQAALAEALLAEIPDQFISYMTINKITPRAPIRVDTQEVVGYEPASDSKTAHQAYAPPAGVPPATSSAGPSTATGDVKTPYSPSAGPPPPSTADGPSNGAAYSAPTAPPPPMAYSPQVQPAYPGLTQPGYAPPAQYYPGYGAPAAVPGQPHPGYGAPAAVPGQPYPGYSAPAVAPGQPFYAYAAPGQPYPGYAPQAAAPGQPYPGYAPQASAPPSSAAPPASAQSTSAPPSYPGPSA